MALGRGKFIRCAVRNWPPSYNKEKQFQIYSIGSFKLKESFFLFSDRIQRWKDNDTNNLMELQQDVETIF